MSIIARLLQGLCFEHVSYPWRHGFFVFRPQVRGAEPGINARQEREPMEWGPRPSLLSLVLARGPAVATSKHARLVQVSDIHAIMSDMPSTRITVRIPEALTTRLRNRSKAKGTTESELVREALETYLGHSGAERSAYDLATEAGIIGMEKNAPRDLSTNRRHFKGFGQGK